VAPPLAQTRPNLEDLVKIPPRVMFLTQIWGTVLGGFINYAVMISIVRQNKAILVDGNGNSSWSGATLQAYNSNATAWALASYLYKVGGQYAMVPLGIVIGVGAVIVHRIFYQVAILVHFFSTRSLTYLL